MEPKYILIVKVPRGIVVRDRPAPESMGAAKMRTEPVGKTLYAYVKINISGVEYAGLVPQNPFRPEWVRVAEPDHSIEYVEVIPLSENGSGELSRAIEHLARALEKMSEK